MPVEPLRVPVTIITGFLGAGKTSLLNHLLASKHGRRLAVLVNDFGAVNIDAGLIQNRDGEVVSLENGCICCSLADGLLATAMGLLRREVPPEHIIIETSGVSDPFEVANTFADPELQPYAPLSGIVTLVDAELAPTLEDAAANLAHRQIAAADLVLLNKTDLVDVAGRMRARTWIEGIAAGVRILETEQGRAPLEIVLGLGGSLIRSEGTHVHANGAHREPAPFDSYVFESIGPMRIDRLHAVLQQMPSTIFRVKGFLYLRERPEYRCILQATGKRALITIGDAWGERPPNNQIVFIGNRGGVDGQRLGEKLRHATA